MSKKKRQQRRTAKTGPAGRLGGAIGFESKHKNGDGRVTALLAGIKNDPLNPGTAEALKKMGGGRPSQVLKNANNAWNAWKEHVNEDQLKTFRDLYKEARALGLTVDVVTHSNGVMTLREAMKTVAGRESITLGNVMIVAPAMSQRAAEGLFKDLAGRAQTTTILTSHRDTTINNNGFPQRHVILQARKATGDVRVIETTNTEHGSTVYAQQYGNYVSGPGGHLGNFDPSTGMLGGI
jgi:hypothetical protein